MPVGTPASIYVLASGVDRLALPDLRHPDHKIGIQGEALDLVARNLGADAENREHIRCVGNDLLLSVVVILLALGLVRVGASVIEPAVDLRVAVKAVVEITAGMPPRICVAVGVDSSRPVDTAGLEMVALALLLVGREFLGLDLHRDAGGRQL